MNTKVYLAGGFKTDWQERVIKNFKDKNITFFNPKLHNLLATEEYTLWDTHFVKECDILFAFMEKTNPSGYGLAFEVGIAKALNKTIILVDEKSVENETFSRYFDIIRFSSGVSFNKLQDGIEYLKKFYVR
tara:strand:- start:3339 stop:3731 length:393 start_codon:yes stop_codon:yes gene_type:complete